ARVDVSVRPPGGDWSAFQPLGATAMGVSDVHVAIDLAGAAAVAWQDTMSPSTFIANVSARPAGGSFGVPETLSGGDVPRVGIDASGNVTLLYAIAGFGCSDVAFAVRKAGIWGATTTPFIHSSTSCPNVATNTLYGGVRVAIDGQGHPVGVVEKSDTDPDCSGFGFSTRTDLIV